MKALICEPDFSTRETLYGVLELEGFEVLVAKNTEEARFKIIMESPDFVLIDWLEFDLQHMDIENFSKQVKRIRPNTIFIFLSHKGLQTNLLDFEKLITKNGADTYILKPFNPLKVIECLRNLQTQA